MKILIFTGFFEKKPSVTAKIALDLAARMRDMGIRADLCGISKAGAWAEEEQGVPVTAFPGQGPVYRRQKKLEKYISASGLDRARAVKKFVPAHPFSALAVKYGYGAGYGYSGDRRRAVKFLERAVREKKYDRCISLINPFWGARRLAGAEIPGRKKIIYQLDPYGLHRLCPEGERKGRIARECRVFGRADLIFTTPALYGQYRQTGEYSRFAGKIFPADFPLFSRLPGGEKGKKGFFDKDFTNILFCGLLEDRYRPIENFLENLSPLWDRGDKIKLWLVGDIISPRARRCREKYPGRIEIKDRVSPLTARSMQAEADFLLNVGNIMDNMVPSKIFEYFARGKPVIHVKNSRNCPAAPYFEKYPLSFVTDGPGQSDGLCKFLREAKGRSFPYEEGRKIFYKNTPEYLAGYIAEKISGLSEGELNERRL